MLTVPSLLLCRTPHFRPLLRELGEGIIPDEVRWQWEKRDPVYWRWMDDHFRMAAEKYMNEIENWRSNEDLRFADFDLLAADIQRFRMQQESVNGKALFRAIVYFKAIHGFTKVTMTDRIEQEAPLEEQNVCVTCGMCCDGTLFLHAVLNNGERGSLPERIEERSYTEDRKDYFRLPCLYFEGKCMIYEQKRADVCSGYRCQLLHDLAGKKIAVDDALAVVARARIMRDEVLHRFRDISGNQDRLTFRQLLTELGKFNKSESDAGWGKEYDMPAGKMQYT